MITGIIIWLIVGAIAGWAAGQVVRGGGFGLIGDIIVGILGAVIAAHLLPWLFSRVGFRLRIPAEIVNEIIFAFIGAVILLLLIRLIRRV